VSATACVAPRRRRPTRKSAVRSPENDKRRLALEAMARYQQDFAKPGERLAGEIIDRLLEGK
jgi:hypothetical protein